MERRFTQLIGRYGSSLGAFALGFLTFLWIRLVHPAFSSNDWLAPNLLIACKVANSVVLGFIAGLVLEESVRREQEGDYDSAADSCLRWGLAGIVLFLLVPMASIDDALRNPAAHYRQMLSFYLPSVAATVALFIRGVALAKRCKR